MHPRLVWLLMALSGLFSFGVPGSLQRGAVSTFNPRGLFVEDDVLRSRKVGKVKGLVNSSTHTLIQEIHGDEAWVSDFTHSFEKTHHIGWSLGTEAAGGVLSLHSKLAFHKDTEFKCTPLVPGRLLLSEFSYQDRTTSFF